jgi:hypothetical protein
MSEISVFRRVGSSIARINPEIIPPDLRDSRLLNVLNLAVNFVGSMSSDDNHAPDDEKIKIERTAVIKCKRSPLSSVLIDNPMKIAVLFANVVTTPSRMPHDWVARNGDKSIFAAFRNVLPEVTVSPHKVR